MIRTFGVQTLGATAQPWFKDTITAAIVAQPNNLSNYQGTTMVTVTATSKYRVGDYLIFDPGQVVQDGGSITQILSPTTMSVVGLINAHAANSVLALNIRCFNVTIQLLDGGTGAAYLGSDNTVTAAPGGNVFYEIQKVAANSQPNIWNYTQSVGYDGIMSGDGWIVGTSGDKFIAAAYVI
jgi:hypothetical protein